MKGPVCTAALGHIGRRPDRVPGRLVLRLFALFFHFCTFVGERDCIPNANVRAENFGKKEFLAPIYIFMGCSAAMRAAGKENYGKK